MKASKRKKSTQAEVESRVQAVADALSSGATRTEVHKLAREQWGVSWQTASEYSRRARERLLADLNRPKPELRLESFSFYQGIADDESQPGHTRVRARQRIDELLGLDAPKETMSKIELDADIRSEVTQQPTISQARIDQALLWRAERLLAAKQKAAATPPPPPPKSAPMVETAPVPAAAATTQPEQVSSEWKPLVPEAGRHFDETALPATVKKRSARRNGSGFLSGLF